MSQSGLNQTVFLQSCYDVTTLPLDSGFEVCFLGRSNVGKSSVINTLCERKKLARVSKTPGRTQCLNVYGITEHARLIDCPGYGYAAVGKSLRQSWQKLMLEYANSRQSLQRFFLVMDARHPWQKNDLLWLDLLADSVDRPLSIVLNKIDCVRKDARRRLCAEVAAVAQKKIATVAVYPTSCLQNEGIDLLRHHVQQVLLLLP